jgi:hypothetical protein
MKIGGRPEPVEAANSWDDLRLGVICQSYLVIAGSPRNAFRCSVPLLLSDGVERLEGMWGSKEYPSLPNSEYV